MSKLLKDVEDIIRQASDDSRIVKEAEASSEPAVVDSESTRDMRKLASALRLISFTPSYKDLENLLENVNAG